MPAMAEELKMKVKKEVKKRFKNSAFKRLSATSLSF